MDGPWRFSGLLAGIRTHKHDDTQLTRVSPPTGWQVHVLADSPPVAAVAAAFTGTARPPAIVVVPGVFAQPAEYTAYLAAAAAAGAPVTVWEVACPTAAHVRAFHARNAHGVPLATLERMRQRWQVDPAATLVEPWLSDAEHAAVAFDQPQDELTEGAAHA